MTYKGYEFFYVNGSSHTAGGGLEDPSIFPENFTDQYYYLKESVLPFYEKKYNVTWKSKREVTYAHRLSEMIGIPHINEAENGGGPNRVVRMTYEFIEKNWKNRHKMFIVLEKPEHAFRVDLFYSPKQEYFIVNYHMNEPFKYKLLCATPNYLKNDEYIHESQPIFREYLDRHHDFLEHGKNSERSFMGLYSFCKMHGIAIKLMSKIGDPLLDNELYQDMIPDTDIINFGFERNTYIDCHIQKWCVKHKMCIADEISENSKDYHPGYFGHIEYSKLLKHWLDHNLEPSKL